MTYEIADILRDVRVILDQNQIEESIIDDHDTLKLDELIHTKILHAARELLETSDVSLLGEGLSHPIIKIIDGEEQIPEEWEGHNIIGPLHIQEMEDGSYGELSVWVLEMPENYLRLLSLRMSDWKRSVYTTIPFESAEYSRLRSGFIGISGNPERPAVAEAKHSYISRDEGNNPVVSAESRRYFEIYTSVTGDVVDFRYCAIPKYYTLEGSTTECLDFPEQLYRMLIYRAAALVEITWKDNVLAQSLMGVISGDGAQLQGGQ